MSYAHTITHTHLYMLIPTVKSVQYTDLYILIHSQVYPHIMSALHEGQFAPLGRRYCPEGAVFAEGCGQLCPLECSQLLDKCLSALGC